MVSVEELVTKVQRANEIIQKGLTENDILAVPAVKGVTGILIFRLVEGEGIHSTAIGAVDFNKVILAVISWSQHADEYDIRRTGQLAT
ncbi:hypothetical protein KKE60_08430 [Patescibacteria group bacterium]|nr:hypothetical protein [Patescibacteria group bacterium]